MAGENREKRAMPLILLPHRKNFFVNGVFKKQFELHLYERIIFRLRFYGAMQIRF